MYTQLLRLHDPDAQLVFPDDVGGLEHFNTDLARLYCLRLANPHNAVPGAFVVALQPDVLADLVDAGNRYQACSDHGNFVSTAMLRDGTAGIQEKLYRNSNIQTFFTPRVNRDCSGTGSRRRAAFIRLHNC